MSINEEEKPEFGDVVVEPTILTRTLCERWLRRTQRERALNVATYTATDPEGESVSLSLMGDDAGLFELNDPETDAGKILVLQEEP